MKDQSTSTAAALRRLWPYIRPVRKPLLLSMSATFGAMLCGLGIPLITQRIVDGPIAHRDLSALPWLVLLVGVLGCTEAALFYTRRRLIARPAAQVEAHLRADIYRKLQRLPVSFHDRYQSGQLLSRASTDVGTVRRWVAFAVIFLVVNTSIVVVGIGVLFWLAPALGVVALCYTLPLVLMSYLFESKFKVVARRAQDQAGDLTTRVEESVLGIRVLKAFGRGPELTRRFAAEARELRNTELAKFKIFALLWAVLIVLPELGIAGQLAIGSIGIADGTTTIGTLVAAIAVSAYLRWPVDSIGWLLAETNQTSAATERIFEVLDAPITITDPESPVPLATPVVGHVRFEDVRFAYPGADREVLRGIDLDLRPGETVALVGATGSGKTTLTALVPRLYDVTSGRVTIDGVDVRDLSLDALRGAIGAAFEEPVLFSASVRENVALGSADVDDSRVRQALRVAKAEEFVEALPWGLETRIGEQGMSLSGGQRQRLALARAVVGHPAVLVLDDPLSALDVHTEAEVEGALRRVLHGVTALVVAHRPSTVQLADRVAMLVDGRIAATGTHRELLADNAEYRRLLSTMEEEEEVVAR
ncbi:ABC transporter ATP-binding protein [Umezawaea sp. Da 62-37]|uniref:ABC transporter ATP-binding protein n=1 Tax=Umezawaea sp. Da 62-37 TaxID=3075927 RepID=UPI0028F73D84|nr:ABC transporter ATP-binding protein [Umezawaea sp. Da 62-37]WNV82052.1 ABC transporter ATP-binding protein [Umezawaea sp. Da 62-37]